MITDLKPYPAMKPSGVEWLGDVPAHWERRKLRQILTPVSERNRPDLPLLSVVRERGVILRNVNSREENHNVVPEDLTNYKVVQVGHFAMNKMKAWQGSYGVSPFHGLVSPAYFVFELNSVRSDFFHTAVRSRAYVPSFIQASDGVRIGQWDLSQEQMKEIPFFIPSPDEQAAIVRYLDHVDRRISRYIRAKQRLVGFLEEERDALMRDVTRNPETQELRLGIVAEQALRSVERIDTEAYEPIGLRNRGRGIFHKPPTVGSDLGDSSFFWVREGDLVLSGQFAWEGAVALANAEDDGCVASHRYPILRGKSGSAETPYLWALFRTQFGELLLNEHSRGAAGRNRPLNLGTLLKEKIPVPPLRAQALVVELIERHRRIAAPTSEALSRFREYRTRLIADVVTGKLNVREAAATLPEVDPVDLEDIVEIHGVAADEFDAELEEVAP